MKTLFRRSLSLLFALFLLLSGAFAFLPGTFTAVKADYFSGIYPIDVSVTFQQTEARRQLDLINQFRTGDEAWIKKSDGSTQYLSDLKPLTYDYNLEKIAMQRAAEIAMLFEHTRPNGESCFSATYDGTMSFAENILGGRSTAESALDLWKETDEDYSGQGHRRSILSSSYTRIGIGHAVYNGIHFWVQEFSAYPGSETPTDPVDTTVPVTIEFSTENISVDGPEINPKKISITTGTTVSIPEAAYYFTALNSWPRASQFAAANMQFSYQSDNPSIATVSENGITGVAPGTTTLTVRAETNGIPFDITDKVTVQVSDLQPDPEPSIEPTPDPEPSVEPTPDPEPSVEPTPDPKPSVEPTPDPEPSIEPAPDTSARPDPEPSAEPLPVFEDVAESSPYYDAIYWAAANGITTGKTPTTFLPDAGCTRAQFVTFLWRMRGEPEPKNNAGFTDMVSSTSPFYKAISWAVEQGITLGYTDNTFRPNETCSRGAAVTFLYRAAGQPEVGTVNTSFSDMVSADHAYYKGIAWAIQNKVTEGYKDGTFKPFRTCSRGQNVTFLYRAKNLLS